LFEIALVFEMFVIFMYLILDYWWAQLLAVFIMIIIATTMVMSIKHKNKKGAKIAAAILAVGILLNVSVYVIFPQDFPYVDLWIYGKTNEEIQSVYGEPRFDYAWEHGGWIGYWNGHEFLDAEYYCIEFDENGKAVEIYETVSPRVPGG